MPENTKIQQKIDLYCPLSPIELATRLRSEMQLSKKRTGYQVFGHGTQTKMNLIHAKRKGPRKNKYFAPQLKAKMTSYGDGTRIKGDIIQRSSARFQNLHWCIFWLIFCLAGTAMWFVEGAPLFSKIAAPGIPGALLVYELVQSIKLAKRKPPKDIGKPDDIVSFLKKFGDMCPFADRPAG